MKTMHLFRISYQDLGEEVEFYPKVPNNRLPEEDEEIPRVCAALTILQCIHSKATYLNGPLWLNKSRNIFIYEADIPVEDIMQPNCDQVSDTWFTGELWIMKPHIWKKCGNYIIKLGERITEDSYLYKYHIHKLELIPFNDCECDYKYGVNGYYNNFFFTEAGPDKRWIEVHNENTKGNK